MPHISVIIQYLPFYVWLISLSIMSFRFIHVVNVRISFFLEAELYSTVYVHHIFFIHSSLNGRLKSGPLWRHLAWLAVFTILSPSLVGEIMAEGSSLGTELCCVGGMVTWVKWNCFYLLQYVYSWIFCSSVAWGLSLDLGPHLWVFVKIVVSVERWGLKNSYSAILLMSLQKINVGTLSLLVYSLQEEETMRVRARARVRERLEVTYNKRAKLKKCQSN